MSDQALEQQVAKSVKEAVQRKNVKSGLNQVNTDNESNMLFTRRPDTEVDAPKRDEVGDDFVDELTMAIIENLKDNNLT